MYDQGYGVLVDHGEAATWFRRSADQGNASAQNALGVMYADGRGVPQDEREALTWFRRAADKGEAFAQFNLGLRYARGEGVPQDNRKAVSWLRRAAEQGHVEAQEQLTEIAEADDDTAIPEPAHEPVDDQEVLRRRLQLQEWRERMKRAGRL